VKVWTVANQKGGVGKTTTAVTLGGVFAARGYRTLLVDLDPHGSLSAYFGLDPDHVEQGAYRLFHDTMVDPERVIADTRFANLALLPASTAMATLDRQLGAQSGKGLVISNALQRLADHYDHVLIDCAPSLGILLVNALAACRHLIIPVQTEFLAIKGLERMLHTLSMVQRSARRELPYTIVPTMFDRRTRAGVLSLDQLRSAHAAHLWSSVIPVDTQFREASRAGVPLSLRSATDRGSVAYAELADHLLHDDSYAPRASLDGALAHASANAH
jgi:chromosome partitioning protein